MTNDDSGSGSGGSGLELDVSKGPPPPARREPSVSAHASDRPLRPRPRRDTEPGGDEELDSSTSGAFIVLALLHLAGGLALAAAAPRGDAVITLALIVAAALITFVVYYITGWIGRNFGVIGMLLFGGWFAFIIGMLAQLVHQMFPWLRWKTLGVVTVLAFAAAFALDLR